MGQQSVRLDEDPGIRRRFQMRLLGDVDALARMIEEGLFDEGPRRIGAEQEMCLIDERGAPAPVAVEILERLKDKRVVPELARFNLEINGSPRVLGGRCFSAMHEEFDEVLGEVRRVAAGLGVRPVLAGSLPSAQHKHMVTANITPLPRYTVLNERLTALRGGTHSLHLRGTDELSITHGSIMTEAVNTSFQIHLQVSPSEFALAHNIAQLIAAPVLAASVNSPFFLGRRLWAETRIPIFEQSIDTRRPEFHERRDVGRVRFGERWVTSAVDLIREDIARLRSVVVDDSDEDSVAELDAGRVPRLGALGMHNSTVYRWNRACYGVTEGVPHLRIENRVMPSGPTTLDEIGSSAFWVGLMLAGMERWADVAERMDFDDARANFTAAARRGLRTRVVWIDGKTHAMDALLLEELATMAVSGLARAGVDADEAERLVGVVTRRVELGRTGSEWIRGAVRARGGATAPNLRRVTSAMADLQAMAGSIADWPSLPETPEHPIGAERVSTMTVGEAMTRELVTVHPGDAAAFGARLMAWSGVHQLPVEDEEHRLLGVLERRAVEGPLRDGRSPVTVAELMREPLPIAEAGTLVEQAGRVLAESGLSSVPVVADGRLIGIFTVTDLNRILASDEAAEEPRPPVIAQNDDV